MATDTLPTADDVTKVIAASIASTAQYVKNTDDIVNAATGATKARVEAEKNKGQAAAVVQKQLSVAELKKQQDTRKVYEAAGGTEMLMKLADAQRRATERLLKEQQDVQENLAHEASNPIDWIANRFSLYYNQVEAEAAARDLQQIDGAIEKITSLAPETAKALNATAQTKTQAVIEAEQKQLAAMTTIEASRAELESLRLNSSVLASANRARGQVFDNIYRGYALRNTEEAMQQRKAEHALSVKRLSFAMEQAKKNAEMAKVQLEQAKVNLENSKLSNPTIRAKREHDYKVALENFERTQEDRKQWIAGVKRGQAILGLDPESDERLQATYDLGGEAIKKYMPLFLIGAEGSDVIGADPADSLAALETYNPDMLYEANNPATKVLLAAKEGVEQKVPNAKGEAKANLINGAVKELMDKAAERIEPGDMNNPNTAAPLPALASYEELKETKAYQEVLAPLKLPTTDPGQIIGLMKQAVMDKKLSVEEATDGIVTLFKVAGIHNTIMQKRERLGLPPQTTYNAPLNEMLIRGGISATDLQLTPLLSSLKVLFGDNIKVIDLTDDMQVKKLLTTIISRGNYNVLDGAYGGK